MSNGRRVCACASYGIIIVMGGDSVFFFFFYYSMRDARESISRRIFI